MTNGKLHNSKQTPSELGYIIADKPHTLTTNHQATIITPPLTSTLGGDSAVHLVRGNVVRSIIGTAARPNQRNSSWDPKDVGYRLAKSGYSANLLPCTQRRRASIITKAAAVASPTESQPTRSRPRPTEFPSKLSTKRRETKRADTSHYSCIDGARIQLNNSSVSISQHTRCPDSSPRRHSLNEPVDDNARVKMCLYEASSLDGSVRVHGPGMQAVLDDFKRPTQFE
ncbi:hypothetical protein EYR40_003133 [Pleurotus pulmonarius]|nr:hypothetical protein EYR40_003133 [Pleurotus pulmonarius]